MAMTDAAVREEKHISILKRMDGLSAAINELEGLANRIDPQPEKPGLAQPPIPTPTLASFLNHAPDDIVAFSDRINTAMNRIKSAVL